MPHDALSRAAVAGWLERLHGRGALAPPRYGLRLHLRDGREIDDWAVGSFTFDERLHAPYALTVVAVTHETEVDLEGLLGGRVTLELDRGEQRRAVHGVVLEAERVEERGDVRVELRVVPALALLGLSRRSRVFRGVSAVEIAMTVLGPVLAEHGGSLCVDRMARIHRPCDVCMQYRETELDFLLRILAAEGITVVFDHSMGIETVVLVDDDAALPVAGREPLEPCDEPPPIVPFVAERADELPIESIQAVARRTCMGEQATATWLCASSNATALRAGSVFELLTAPDEEQGEIWVVTAARHQGDATAARADGSTEHAVPQYANEIECQPLREPVTPPRMPKPQVVGVCSAIMGEQPKDPNRLQGLSIEVARGGYELAAAESIVLRCGNSRLELLPDRIVLRSPRIEAKGPKASLVLDGDAVTIRADKKLELGADVLAAVSTSMTVIKGPTCEIGGVTVDIEGERISVEASARIDIATPGEVDIRGAEMIKLN